MRTVTTVTKVYKFSELSDDAKETAINAYRENNLDYEWWEYIYDDTKEIAALMGIEIDNIYFSGFWSQGDGACFEGHYSYKKGSVAAVKSHAPKDEELHRIVEELVAIQRPNFYQLTANVKQRGHYMHANCTDIDVNQYSHEWGGVSDSAEEDIKEALRDFMNWVYRRLEAEQDYLQSDETITESIEANNYEFTGYGDMA